MIEQTQNSIFLRFNQIDHTIMLDKIGYICLDDLIKFFPDKQLDDWMKLDSTQESIKVINNQLQLEDSSSSKKAYYTKEDKINDGIKQGTYAHKYLALEFLAWLSLEFKIMVVRRLERLYKEELIKKEQLKNKSNRFQQIAAKSKKENNDTIKVLKNLLEDVIKPKSGKENTLKEYDIHIQVQEREIKVSEGASKIYIIYDQTNHQYKIGRDDLSSSHKKGIKLKTTLNLKSSAETAKLERFLYEKFSHKRNQGEWFKLDQKDLAFIEMLKVYIQDLS